METLGKIFVIIITLIISVLISFLSAYIISCIGNMFNLPFIINLSILQIFAYTFIIGLISHRPNSKEYKDFAENIIDIIKSLFQRVILILLSWGIISIIYLITT